jgi:hypothetical protein
VSECDEVVHRQRPARGLKPRPDPERSAIDSEHLNLSIRAPISAFARASPPE